MPGLRDEMAAAANRVDAHSRIALSSQITHYTPGTPEFEAIAAQCAPLGVKPPSVYDDTHARLHGGWEGKVGK